MTTKEKAQELYDKCYPHAFHPSKLFNTSDNGGHTKALALICVDEIIKSHKEAENLDDSITTVHIVDWWGMVRKHLEKL